MVVLRLPSTPAGNRSDTTVLPALIIARVLAWSSMAPSGVPNGVPNGTAVLTSA